MKTVEVSLGDRSYRIHIAAGLLSRAAAYLSPLAPRGMVTIVADENVSAHLATLTAALGDAGIDWHVVLIPAGEASKSWSQLQHVCDRLLDIGVERTDPVIALGGGVIGDLVGFACAILKRGCRFVQVPTTLLAQVDSSVGGKTAINTGFGKNLIGAFHQPDLVLIDPDVLDTLDAREVRAGYAEVVKYGLIDDFAFFDWCEANGAALLAGEPDARVEAIAYAVASKAATVAADEFETNGRRALLNLGHTFGHALEAEAAYSGDLLHGEAVAAGCSLAFDFSVARGLCSGQDAERVKAHWRRVGLPDGLAAARIAAGGERLVEHMRHDKKASGGRVPFILARGIGKAYVDKTVDLADVVAFLDAQPR